MTSKDGGSNEGPAHERIGYTLGVWQLPGLTESTLKILMGEKAKEWRQPWDAQRNQECQVVKQRDVEAAIERLNIKFTNDAIGAFYNPDTDTVNIPPINCFFDTEYQEALQAYYMTLFHEIVHWTIPRVKRSALKDMSWNYAQEELVAELGAVVLMRHFRLKVGDPSLPALYFQDWLDQIPEENREDAMTWARTKALEAVQYIVKQCATKTYQT